MGFIVHSFCSMLDIDIPPQSAKITAFVEAEAESSYAAGFSIWNRCGSG